MGDSSYYSLERLARAANMTARNVRAYQTRGLLPSPLRDGRSAIYTEDHLKRLTQIHELRQVGVPLRMIKEAVSRGESLGKEGPLHTWASGQLNSEFSAATSPPVAPRTIDLASLERAQRSAPEAHSLLQDLGMLTPGESISSSVGGILHALPDAAALGVNTGQVVQAAAELSPALQRLLSDTMMTPQQRVATVKLAMLVSQAAIARASSPSASRL